MLTIDTARIFSPLLQPSRYKGAWGGRGSGKSHYLAGAVVEHCLLNPGSRIVCIREVQKTLAQSAKLLIENKIQEFGVGSQFRVLYERIVRDHLKHQWRWLDGLAISIGSAEIDHAKALRLFPASGSQSHSLSASETRARRFSFRESSITR